MAEKITAELVKTLRESTGAGMMECKKALQEANGNMEQAVEIIAKAGHRKADKKADRTAAEGVMTCKIAANEKDAVMIEINCETDFVARDENFKSFCENITALALSKGAHDLEQLKALAYDAEMNVEEARKALISKIGENVNIRRIQYIHTDTGRVGSYLHGAKIGVLVLLEGGDSQLAKDIAMHVAASRPQFIASNEVSQHIVERETRIYKERAAESGKPEAIIDKMVTGQLQKYFNEICLLGQPFVKDLDQTVEKVLKAGHAEIKAFYRFEVGEGIEVQKMSFQDEVMATARGK